MPETVSYWTGIWDPQREAISKEVATLRNALAPRARVVSIATDQRPVWRRRDNVICLSGNQWPLLRALAVACERQAAVTHVVGELNAWHLLRAVGRRPVMFTVVAEGDVSARPLYSKVALFVAESDRLAAELRRAGVPRDRIRIVYPGVDLQRFHPGPRPGGAPFRVLFASSPAHTADLEARGISLLMQAARLRPDVTITVLMRQWGDAAAMDDALATMHPPSNVEIVRRDVADMAAVYRQHDAVAFLPAPAHGKSAPNSIVEGLASGCAALVSDTCGLADVVVRTGAGFAVPRDPAAIADALGEMQVGTTARRARARSAARHYFDATRFIAAYRSFYEELVTCSLSAAAAPMTPGAAR